MKAVACRRHGACLKRATGRRRRGFRFPGVKPAAVLTGRGRSHRSETGTSAAARFAIASFCSPAILPAAPGLMWAETQSSSVRFAQKHGRGQLRSGARRPSLHLAPQHIETFRALVFEPGQNLGVGFSHQRVGIDTEEQGRPRIAFKLQNPPRRRSDIPEYADVGPLPVLVSY
jgi:hypothetical protein